MRRSLVTFRSRGSNGSWFNSPSAHVFLARGCVMQIRLNTKLPEAYVLSAYSIVVECLLHTGASWVQSPVCTHFLNCGTKCVKLGNPFLCGTRRAQHIICSCTSFVPLFLARLYYFFSLVGVPGVDSEVITEQKVVLLCTSCTRIVHWGLTDES